MKCCNNQNLYVESDSKIHKEHVGEFVVMCSGCKWSDNYIFMKKEMAESRIIELVKLYDDAIGEFVLLEETKSVKDKNLFPLNENPELLCNNISS